MAEVEVISLMNLAGMEVFFQDVVGKLVRRHQREIASKRQHQNRVERGGLEEAEFFRGWSQQFESMIGAQNAGRMRLEGDDDGMRLGGLGAANDFIDDRAVRAVDAIKIADADKRGTEVARNFVEFVKDLHSVN